MVDWYIALIIGAASVLVGVFAGYVIRRVVAEKQIGSAEQQAKKLLEDAIKAAGYPLTTPLIVCNTDDYAAVKPLASGAIKNGADVLRVE